jgi:glycosyltransferase involved in cell wall biosynthesis
MSSSSQPLVSVLTPVYNDAEYLSECIESVLAQTYTNWEYTIVDNCSKDESCAIAQKYAAKDARIRVVTNSDFLRIIQNHNRTIQHLSPLSKYCKFVFADDWLYPACLEEMVRHAEQNPSAGLVSSYTMDGRAVLWEGPKYSGRAFSGREVCREKLLGGPYVFGTMTTMLVRSDLIRKRPKFFNEENLHADNEACFDVLQESDFGFVHQILSYSRPRPQSNHSLAQENDSIELGEYVIFLKYGPVFLNPAEYERRKAYMCRWYHRVLATNVLRLRPQAFWQYHERTLAAFNTRIDRGLLSRMVVTELASRLSHPLHALRMLWQWWSRALLRLVSANRAVRREPAR